MRRFAFAAVVCSLLVGCAVEAEPTPGSGASGEIRKDPTIAPAPEPAAPSEPAPGASPTIADLGKACSVDADCAPLAFPYCYPFHTTGLKHDLFGHCTMHVGDRYEFGHDGAQPNNPDWVAAKDRVDAEYEACAALGPIRYYGEVDRCPPNATVAACDAYYDARSICVPEAEVIVGGPWDGH